jgi:hypothetical protein
MTGPSGWRQPVQVVDRSRAIQAEGYANVRIGEYVKGFFSQQHAISLKGDVAPRTVRHRRPQLSRQLSQPGRSEKQWLASMEDDTEML